VVVPLIASFPTPPFTVTSSGTTTASERLSIQLSSPPASTTTRAAGVDEGQMIAKPPGVAVGVSQKVSPRTICWVESIL